FNCAGSCLGFVARDVTTGQSLSESIYVGNSGSSSMQLPLANAVAPIGRATVCSTPTDKQRTPCQPISGISSQPVDNLTAVSPVGFSSAPVMDSFPTRRSSDLFNCAGSCLGFVARDVTTGQSLSESIYVGNSGSSSMQLPLANAVA